MSQINLLRLEFSLVPLAGTFDFKFLGQLFVKLDLSNPYPSKDYV
jgi:hypothetical protein